MGRMVGVALATAVVALAGCKDLGVRGAANVPLSVARTRPTVFWAYQAVNPAGQRKAYEGLTGDRFSAGEQSFIVEFPDFSGPRTMLRSVGRAGAGAAFALSWDQPPYDELYVAVGADRLHVAPAIWR